MKKIDRLIQTRKALCYRDLAEDYVSEIMLSGHGIIIHVNMENVISITPDVKIKMPFSVAIEIGDWINRLFEEEEEDAP